MESQPSRLPDTVLIAVVTFLALGALVQVGLMMVVPVALAFVGATQLLFVVPLLLSARKQQRPVAFRVYLIMAGMVLLINAGCWGLFAMSGFH